MNERIAFIKSHLATGCAGGVVRITTKDRNIIRKIKEKPVSKYIRNQKLDPELYGKLKREYDDYMASVLNPYVQKKVRDVYYDAYAHWDKVRIFKRKPKGKGISSRQKFYERKKRRIPNGNI